MLTLFLSGAAAFMLPGSAPRHAIGRAGIPIAQDLETRTTKSTSTPIDVPIVWQQTEKSGYKFLDDVVGTGAMPGAGDGDPGDAGGQGARREPRAALRL